MMDNQLNTYDKDRPFLSTIKERYLLCAEGSLKNTVHISLDISNSGMGYRPGDCVAVYPVNDPILTAKTLEAIQANGDELVIDKRSGKQYTLKDFFRLRANVSDLSQKLIKITAERQSNAEKRRSLESLLENREAFKAYVAGRQLFDFLQENQEAAFSYEELAALLQPMLPRFYSIASSQSVHREEIHLTVKLIEYAAHGYERKGVCTHYLCNLSPLEEPIVPMYIHPHRGFTLPEDDDAPIIMVGPGTGVAPFRAFMQERIARGASGKNWLFFGEWNRDSHYLYGDYWESLAKSGKLELDLAFSRDQKDKLYVQHRMMEKGKTLVDWLDRGAYFYVCGDARLMAKDVEEALKTILEKYKDLSTEQTKAYIKALRKEGRYLRDVY